MIKFPTLEVNFNGFSSQISFTNTDNGESYTMDGYEFRGKFPELWVLINGGDPYNIQNHLKVLTKTK